MINPFNTAELEATEEEDSYFESAEDEVGTDDDDSGDTDDVNDSENTADSTDEGGDDDSDDDGNADDDDAGEDDDDSESIEVKGKGRMVSLNALHSAREKAKARVADANARVAAANTRVERLEAQFSKVLDRLTEKPQDSAPEPEPVTPFDENPAENLDARLRQIEAGTEQSKEAAKTADQQQQQFQASQELAARFQQSEIEYKSENPDYGAAIDHLHHARVADMVSMGASQAEAEQAWIGEVLHISQRAYDTGKNPAEILFARAGTFGYNKNTKSGKDDNSDPDERVAQVRKGQKKSSRMATGGAQQAGTMTLETLAALPDEEFDAAFEKMRDKGRLG